MLEQLRAQMGGAPRRNLVTAGLAATLTVAITAAWAGPDSGNRLEDVGSTLPFASTNRRAIGAIGGDHVSTPQPAAASSATDPSFERLPALTLVAVNAAKSLEVRLYTADGQIDEMAVKRVSELLDDPRSLRAAETSEHVMLDRRLLQLVYRAAHHFRHYRVTVTSALRAPGRGRGRHARGLAIDFKLPGVKPQELAAYLRRQPRVGVGVYTHRRTQYVHLDVRDQSYHWLDASPPGRRWRGLRLPDPGLGARDASYTRAADWPEGVRVP